MVEKYKTQFDGCTLCGGKRMDGLDCTPTATAMLLYRATQGRVDVSACHVRDMTDDCYDGTRLDQMVPVLEHYGVHGVIYRPIRQTTLRSIILQNVYPVIVQVGYAPIAGTAVDCFHNSFHLGHAIYVSGGTSTAVIEGDPGANGRTVGSWTAPHGFQRMSWTTFGRALNALPLKVSASGAVQLTLAQEVGPGFAYAYVGPKDKAIAAPHYKATVSTATALWNDATQRWTYNGSNALRVGTVLEVRGVGYTKGGVPCHPVVGPSPYQPSYYVPTSHVRLSPL